MFEMFAPNVAPLVQYQQLSIPKFYTKAVLHVDSQFNVRGGSNSCTYICMEMAQYFLNGLIIHDSADLLPLIKQVLIEGVKQDLQIGNTSSEQVLPKIKRFSDLYQIPSTAMGKLKNPNVFHQFLESMIAKQVETGLRQVNILTKPPETIAVFYDKDAPFPFVIFDSHPRSFELDKGAGFYFFKTINGCEGHLKTLFKLSGPEPPKQSPEYMSWASNNMFDAANLILKSQRSVQQQPQQIPAPQQVQAQAVPQPQQAANPSNNASSSSAVKNPSLLPQNMIDNLKLVEAIEKYKQEILKEKEEQMAQVKATLKKEAEDMKVHYQNQIAALQAEVAALTLQVTTQEKQHHEKESTPSVSELAKENADLKQLVAKQTNFIQLIQQITSSYKQ